MMDREGSQNSKPVSSGSAEGAEDAGDSSLQRDQEKAAETQATEVQTTPAIRRRHRTDPRAFRATFGWEYPDEELDLESRDDVEKGLPKPAGEGARAPVVRKKVVLSVRGVTLEAVDFRECNFHTTQGKSATQIQALSFRNCNFDRCGIGYVLFRRTHFERCSFRQCDFSRSEFIECTLQDCTFSQCSAELALFTRTEVDPTSVLNGITFLSHNMTSLADTEREQYRTRWQKSRAWVSAQLYRSNADVRNEAYSDMALCASRREALNLRKRLWLCGGREDRLPVSLWRAILSRPGEAIRLTAIRAFLYVTSGGTSVVSMLQIASVLIALYPFGFVGFHIEHRNTPLFLNSGLLGALGDYLAALPVAVSLFLGFGFTNLGADGPTGTGFLVVAAGLGLVWVAVLIPVLVRRVAR